MKKLLIILMTICLLVLISCDGTGPEPTVYYITVTSPNGGEDWRMGTSHNITWNDNISSNVKIELYKSGSYYRTISNSTSSDGTYSWSIPTDLVESSSYKVKVTSTSNSSVNDQSNNYFTIKEADYITLTSPNGSETWQMGTLHNITWNDNITSNVKIELYKSGSFNITIVSSTGSDGTYSWSIPTDLTESSSYKVKITSTSNSSVNDQSNNYFTIEEADYITVTTPNGGETWEMGTSCNITWNDNISSNVKIELYKSGSFYRTISSSTSSDGTYNWNIPNDLEESSIYKVKITSTSNGSLNDYSDNYFTIEEETQADYITITSPNGSETWQMSTSHNITWDDNISSNVKIELYKSGSYYRTISSSTSSDGTYNWSIPTDLVESSWYKVKIISTSNSSLYDESNSYFTIEEQPYITVTSPNGGETCQMGTSYNITWDDNISSNVKIELCKSGTYNILIEDSTPSDGSYSWSIPTDLTASSSYKVKVTSNSNSSIYDYSNNDFTIEESDYITVTSPNGGETWEMGTSCNITWNDNVSSNVKIELYKSGSYYRTITTSTSSDGLYSSIIPTDLAESSSYKVKITSTSNSSVYDYSNNYFTIEESDYITVTSPNGGENWKILTVKQITWNDNISSNVKIDLYKSGSYYRTITTSTSSDGFYNWNISNVLEESSSYKVKITSTSNSSIYDYSNNNFTLFVDSGTVTDVDGNVYNTIWIGDQRWMMENLKVTHYRNGATIPKVTNNGTWAGLSTGAYCNYGNDNGNVATYGRLYNWYAVDDSRGIAPEGWHVPTYDDWQILLDYLGSGAGGKMKETGTTHWNSPNTGATNESGFTALPGGYRHYYDGDFLDMGNYANFWCSSVYSSTYVWNIYLATHNNGCSIEPHFKGWGFSIRCVKD